jgi:hypothetical protein
MISCDAKGCLLKLPERQTIIIWGTPYDFCYEHVAEFLLLKNKLIKGE